MMEIGDIVKYLNGSRNYKITCKQGNHIKLDDQFEASTQRLIQLNKYRKDDLVIINNQNKDKAYIVDVYVTNDGKSFYYVCLDNNRNCIKLSESSILKKHENRLQEQEDSVSGRDGSGVDRAIHRRGKISLRINDLVNKTRPHKVSKRTPAIAQR